MHTWSGFQRLYTRILLAPAAARSATTCCDQWLHRLPVQFTLSAVVSCTAGIHVYQLSDFMEHHILSESSFSSQQGPETLLTTQKHN